MHAFLYIYELYEYYPMKKSLISLLLISSTIVYGDQAASPSPFHQKVDDGYTINYNNVALSEYVRFVSKITGVNFLFNEAELAEGITIISEEPLSTEAIMGTLTQMLRIQGFELLQEGNNLVIHKNPDVQQPAHLFFAGKDLDRRYPLTTAVFRLNYAKAGSISDALKPMLSKAAQVDILQESNQLIVTDTTETIGQIQTLIAHLDTSSQAVTIEPYQVKNTDPTFLLTTAREILSPLIGGAPFLLMHPQGSANIYIIAKSPLVEKALGVLRKLDQDSSQKGFADPSNVFLYPIAHRSAKTLLDSIQEIASRIEKNGYQSKGFIAILRSVSIAGEGKSLLFTGDPQNLAKIAEMMPFLDTPQKKKPLTGENVFLYSVRNQPIKDLIDTLKKIAASMAQEGYTQDGLIATMKSAVGIDKSHSILFLGNPSSFPKLEEIIQGLDSPTQKKRLLMQNSFFLYRPLHASPQRIYESFQEIFSHLKNVPIGQKELLGLQDRVSIIRGSGSLLFTGDSALFPKIRDILALIDVAPSMEKENQFLSYRPKILTGEEIVKAMNAYGKNLRSSGFSNPDVLEAIHTMKWIKANGTLVFTGPPAALENIETLLDTIDSESALAEAQTTFFLYQLKNVSKESFEEYFKDISSKLNTQEIKEENLLKAIDSMKWIQQSHSFLFTGTNAALLRIQTIADVFDVPAKKASSPTFILYPIKTVSRKMVEKYLDQLAQNLDQTNQKQDALYKAIRSMKWIENSGSFMFSGSPTALDTLENILTQYDQSTAGPGDRYFLYKLQYVQGDIIEQELEHFAENMRSASVRDNSILEVIENLKWIKQTNSILLTGPMQAVEEVRNLIAQYDVRVKRTPGELHSDFYMYKPQYLSADVLQLSLADIAKNLEAGGLMDEGLLTAIQSMKYSSQTNSLVFTGNPAALQKIASIIEEIDIPSAKDAAVQRIGRTTFLLYKLKSASGRYITESLEKVIEDLKKSKNYDPELLKTLQSMKYIRETNSLLFTGPEEALEKAKLLVTKFDVPSLGEIAPPSEFFVYKPEYLSGPDLERLLLNFADHLKDTGLVDPELYSSLYSVKFVPDTKSLIFTGTSESLAKTRELIQSFDLPTGEQAAKTTDIQPIDNTSFLVYKLQYHKGSEIQDALKRIAKDLVSSKNSVSDTLLDAIASVQWLEITNSLLVTGDQETLTRLKELIKNLDVPLKQVFIEILAIQTTLSNMLDFGLEWGGKGNFRDRFAASTGNFAPVPQTGDAFATALNTVNGATFPDPSNIPFTQPGGSLGVIGDVILHRGKSFFSLGSLLSALQTDSEVSILLTPKIITQDNRTSTLFVGQNIPFIGSVVQNVNSTTTLFQNTNVEYRDIGLNLTITPVIGNSNIVSLDIQIENSVDTTDASGDTLNTVNNQSFSAITTSKTTLETTVHVPNESFLVLSGLVNSTNTKTTSAVPCLGGLPFIGAAFSQNNRSKNTRNIVFFIRPRILHSREDLRAITEEQEDFFREKSTSPSLEADFDEGMEAIKSIHDE